MAESELINLVLKVFPQWTTAPDEYHVTVVKVFSRLNEIAETFIFNKTAEREDNSSPGIFISDFCRLGFVAAVRFDSDRDATCFVLNLLKIRRFREVHR